MIAVSVNFFQIFDGALWSDLSHLPVADMAVL